MRKLSTAVLIVMGVGFALAPGAGAVSRTRPYIRTRTAEYQASGNLYATDTAYAMGRSAVLGENIIVPTKLTDRFASIELVDSTGLPVGGVYSQDRTEGSHGFCGSTGNIRVKGGAPVSVWVVQGRCGAMAAPSAGTTGLVTFRFSNETL